MTISKSSIRAAAQGFVLTLERFGRRELANHAAAGAYGFLLSAAPAVFVVFWLVSMALPDPGALATRLAGMVAPFLGGADAEAVLRLVYSRRLAGLSGLVAALNLVWAGRVFILSVQRGLRVVHDESEAVDPLKANLLTFVGELLVLVAIVAVLVGAQTLQALAGSILPRTASAPQAFLLRLSLDLAPLAVLALAVYITYRVLPSRRPSPRRAALAALGCTLSFALISALLGLLLDASRFGLLYGVLGNLLAALAKVYLFFSFYYFFAELGAVFADFDVLVFARYQRARKAGSKGLDGWLYGQPDRLFSRFGRTLEPGEPLFAEGDADKTAYFVAEGSIGIYLGRKPAPETLAARIGEGELFGEMAFLLDEARTATAAALEASNLIALPPEVFERLIATDARAARRVVAALAARLRNANRRTLSDAIDLDAAEETPLTAPGAATGPEAGADTAVPASPAPPEAESGEKEAPRGSGIPLP